MNQLSLEDMVLALPFEQTYKTELLSKLPTLDQERKGVIESIITDLYQGILALKSEQNIQTALLEGPQDMATGEDFFKKMKEKTEEDLLAKVHPAATPHTDLAETRHRLQEVIAEKHPV